MIIKLTKVPIISKTKQLNGENNLILVRDNIISALSKELTSCIVYNVLENSTDVGSYNAHHENVYEDYEYQISLMRHLQFLERPEVTSEQFIKSIQLLYSVKYGIKPIRIYLTNGIGFQANDEDSSSLTFEEAVSRLAEELSQKRTE